MLIALSLLPGLALCQIDEAGLEAIEPNAITQREGDGRLWVDALSIGLEGQGFTDLAHPYDRLPADAEGVVRDPVWGLSHDSAGLAVRFWSDATAISARWTLRRASLEMPHMPATGVSGLDLYVRGDEGWRWIGAGRPSGVESEGVLADGIAPGLHDTCSTCHVYNGVDQVLIGLSPEARILRGGGGEGSAGRLLRDLHHPGRMRSRPGMAYAAIIGRWLDLPTVNLGFSGNGQMEPEMGEQDRADRRLRLRAGLSPQHEPGHGHREGAVRGADPTGGPSRHAHSARGVHHLPALAPPRQLGGAGAGVQRGAARGDESCSPRASRTSVQWRARISSGATVRRRSMESTRRISASSACQR